LRESLLLLDISEGGAEVPAVGSKAAQSRMPIRCGRALRGARSLARLLDLGLAGWSYGKAGSQKTLVEWDSIDLGHTHIGGYRWAGNTPHTIHLGAKEARPWWHEVGAVCDSVSAEFEILRLRGVEDVIAACAHLDCSSRWTNLLAQVTISSLGVTSPTLALP
jgi:hypothetical protein